MTITALSTQPNSVSRPTTFNADSDTYHSELPTLITEINSTVAAMNALAAGGAVSLKYTFSTTTTDADPGTGILRLDNATQNAATVIRVDLTDNAGSDMTNVLALLDDSTSSNKGILTLRHTTDATKWLTFKVASMASPAGYRNVTVTNPVGSAATPFANGDSILLDFTATGDKGDTGKNAGLSYVYSSTITATDPTAGKLQFDNATLASATKLYISETDADTNGIAAEIATWDDSTSANKAKLKVYKSTDPTKWAEYFVTGSNTDNGTWDTLNLTYITGAGALTDADAVTLLVIQTANMGAACTNGTGALITNIVTATTATTLTSTPTLLKITPTSYGVPVTLPDATTCTAGGVMHIIDNKGDYPIKVFNSAGALLGLINGRVVSHISLENNASAVGAWAVENSELVGVTAQLLSTTLNYDLLAVALDSDRELVLGWGSGSAYLYGVVFQKSTGQSGTVTAVRSVAMTGRKYYVIKSATDQALVVSCDGTTGFEAVVLSITGTTITVNTAATATLSANLSAFADGCGLIQAGTSFVASYTVAGPAVQLRAITISGTTPTIGSAVSPSGTAGGQQIAATSSVVLVASTTAAHTYATPYTVSGSTLTVGTEYDSGIITSAITRFGSWSSAYFFIVTGAQSVIVITLAADVATGTKIEAVMSANILDAVIVSSNKLLILNDQTTNNANIITNTAGTISAGTAITTAAGISSYSLYQIGTNVYIHNSISSTYKLICIDCSGASPVLGKVVTTGVAMGGASNSMLSKSASYLFGATSSFAQNATAATMSGEFRPLNQTPIRFAVAGSYRGVADNERWVTDAATWITKVECVA